MLPVMVTPQRQLLLPQETQTEFETDGRDKVGNKEGEEEGESEEEDDYEDEEEEGDNETSEFEIIIIFSVEKWENINKYFKKVKESNKKRPLDSKTCPYFHQLEALYNERNKSGALPMLPVMVTPQRQLLLPQETQTEFETDGRDKVGNKEGEEEGESEEEDDYEDEEEEGDNETSEFEIVLNKTSSPMDINNNLFT
ncbi:hypothetical protein F2Q70_00045570 [Brassica cretica]|uniref:Myb/SANT-like DNA-binding domain-containing protein n=1 Tax=Brassica cretica TaxID=69181 RepID=A0A8S9KG63_BRACR|nr:hypothetical protein F2Q70_00045570 [Brassica cretica]